MLTIQVPGLQNVRESRLDRPLAYVAVELTIRLRAAEPVHKGRDRSYVDRVEKGKVQPTDEEIEILAELYGLTPAEFAAHTKDPAASKWTQKAAAKPASRRKAG